MVKRNFDVIKMHGTTIKKIMLVVHLTRIMQINVMKLLWYETCTVVPPTHSNL